MHVRAAIVLAIVMYWPGLLEQFEHPKAAVVRVLGAGFLAAAVATVLARGRAARAPAVPSERRRGRAGRPPGPAEAPRPSTEAHAPRWSMLDSGVAAWFLVEIIATVGSVAPAISLFGDTQQHEGLLTSIGLAGLYAAARVATTGAASARRTLLVTLAAVAVACAVAIWQLTTFDPARWQNAPAYLGWYRPFGSLGHANLLGAMTAAAFAATAGLAASRALSRWWWASAGLLFATTTVLTFSRAAWLAAAGGALLAVVLARPWRGRTAGRRDAGRAAWVGAVAALAVLLAVFVLVEPLRVRALEMAALGSGSGRARLEIWRTGVAMWLAHPWLGSGPDTFHLLFGRHQTASYWSWEWGAAPFHAHSIYVHALATRGIAGVLAALVVVAGAVQALHAAGRRDAAGRELAPAVAGLLLALAIAGVGGVLGIAGAAAVAALLGTLPALAAPREPARVRSARRTGAAPLVAGGLAALLALAPTGAQILGSQAAFRSGEEERASHAIDLARGAARMVPWSDVLAANAAEVLRRGAGRTPDPHGSMALAEDYARRAIRLAPQRLYNQSELALILLTRDLPPAERDRQARAAIDRCVELCPYNIMPLVHYADLASRIGRGDLALPAARRAAEIYPQEAITQALLGEAYLAVGDGAAARAAMERSLALAWHGDLARRERVQRLLASPTVPSGRFILGGP